MKRSLAQPLKKLESHLPKDGLCQVCLQLALGFWRDLFSECCSCTFIISRLSPFGKRCGRSFEQNWVEEVYFSYFAIISPRMKTWPFIRWNLNPHLPTMLQFVLRLVEIKPRWLKKKREKFTTTTDKALLSLLSRWAKKRLTV